MARSCAGILVLVCAAQLHAGEIPEPYRDMVTRGLTWLARQQRPDGSWAADRDQYPVAVTSLAGMALALGYIVAGLAPNLWVFALAHGVLIGGLGTAATFGPVIADITQWFTRRRGLAVGIAASGSYLSGAIWPPVVQHFVDAVGWRTTHVGIGVF